MEDDKPTGTAELEDEDDEDDENGDEQYESFLANEEEQRAAIEALEKALPFERWLELSAERDHRATEHQTGEPGDETQNR